MVVPFIVVRTARTWVSLPLSLMLICTLHCLVSMTFTSVSSLCAALPGAQGRGTPALRAQGPRSGELRLPVVGCGARARWPMNHARAIATLADSTPISAHVPVDFELRGCA